MKTIPGFAVARGSVPCVIAASLLAMCLMTPVSFAAQQAEAVKEKARKHRLSWNPPNIDSPVRSARPSPPCVLANVLEHASTRANELRTDLQNFKAQ